MSPKTKAPTRKQVDQALQDYVELYKQFEASDGNFRKSRKAIELEVKIARARVLQADCQRTTGQLFDYIYARLPSKELQELFGIYSLLIIGDPQISQESYNLFRTTNNRAKRLMGLMKPPRRTK